MSFSKIQLLAVLGAIAALVLVIIVPFSSPLKPGTAGPSAPVPGAAGTPPSNVPQNAFLPNGVGGETLPDNGGIASESTVSPANPPITYELPPIPGLKDIIVQAIPSSTAPPASSRPAPAQTPQTAVVLPSVSDAEITIDPKGISAQQEYIIYAVSHYADLQFDNKKLDSVLKDENKLPLLPIALIEKGIADNNFSEVRDSLLVYQEFIRARSAFLKSVGVSGSAIETDKRLLGFDKLALSLIDKFLAADPAGPSGKDFKAFFDGFKKTALAENRNLLKQFGLSAFLDYSNPLASLLKRLGPNTALAGAGMPFGGTLGTPKYCSCSAAYLASMGPPTPPKTGFLFIPVWFLSSPLFFLNESLKAGSWWLGLDTPAPVPCMQYAGNHCRQDGNGDLVYMAGTSI